MDGSMGIRATPRDAPTGVGDGDGSRIREDNFEGRAVAEPALRGNWSNGWM